MNPIDILLIILIAGAAALALRSVIRKRKNGGCSCGCAGCPSSCKTCSSQNRMDASDHELP